MADSHINNETDIAAALESYYEAIRHHDNDRANTEWRMISHYAHLIADPFERELFLSMPHWRRA